ncbi:MAG: HAMP domain-containing histidine kinase [Clostridia bacterium]|nr:HAMP domain-containing histidine kinase [Clostridia bacterium]
MKKFYRRRLITVSMLAFLILFILVFSGMFLFSFLQMESETNRTVQALLNPQENAGQKYEGVRMPGAFQSRRGQPMFSSYYDITASKDGTVTACETRGILNETETDIQSFVRQTLAAGKTGGRWGTFKFGVQETADGQMHIILMNISIQLQMLLSMVRSALIIGTALMVLLFIILLPVTAKAASILIQNTEKQKQFITDAGHELKTPVAVIRSNLDVMELLQGKSNWSANIRSQVERLDGLVKQLLLLARLDEKQWAGKTSDIDFSGELKNEVSIYEETVTQKELTLKTDISEGLHIHAEEESVRQLIHVLLDNAMQYTPSGGSVQIRAGKEKRNLCLEVTNTVDAFPQIEPERLLDRFVRGDTARSRKNGGTGIGLSTAKSVADLYHGDITVAYLEGNQFQVTVRLPLTIM